MIPSNYTNQTSCLHPLPDTTTVVFTNNRTLTTTTCRGDAVCYKKSQPDASGVVKSKAASAGASGAPPSSKKSSSLGKPKKNGLSLDKDERLKRQAFGWYLTLRKPSRNTMEQIIQTATTSNNMDNDNGNGMDMISLADVARLPWDAHGEFFVREAQMVSPVPAPLLSDDVVVARRHKQVARRDREDEMRSQQVTKLLQWQQTKQTAPAPAVPPNHVKGDMAQAYRWFRQLGQPTKETYLAVVQEIKGAAIPVTKAQIEGLPWIRNDRLLDYERLAEMLTDEEAVAIGNRHQQGSGSNNNNNSNNNSNNGPDMDPRVLAAILKAYRESTDLGIPKSVTFVKFVNQATGKEYYHDDVSVLGFDEEEDEQIQQSIDEDPVVETQHRLQDQMSKEMLQEVAKRKRAEERQKRHERIARKAAKARALEKEKKKSNDEKLPLTLDQRRQVRQAEWEAFSGDRQAWEETRALQAYAWYTRLSGPKRDRLKAIVESMKECDVVPDDVDLLPWNTSGWFVNIAQITEMRAKHNA